MINVLVVWLLGTLVAVSINTLVVGWNGPAVDRSVQEGESRPVAVAVGRESLALSLAMGVVWVTAMVPLWALGADAFPTGYFVAGSIRVVGTVALFFVGSYTTGASAESLAAWILVWHVTLLAAEVVFRARMPLDSPHETTSV